MPKAYRRWSVPERASEPPSSAATRQTHQQVSAVGLALAVRVVEVQVQGDGQATSAVLLVEHWYRHYIAIIVEERRADASELAAPMLAVAHELAWRHAVVAAARQSDPAEWQALTVVHEAATYEHLLVWTADTYDVRVTDVRAAQTTTGYRKQPR